MSDFPEDRPPATRDVAVLDQWLQERFRRGEGYHAIRSLVRWAVVLPESMVSITVRSPGTISAWMQNPVARSEGATVLMLQRALEAGLLNEQGRLVDLETHRRGMNRDKAARFRTVVAQSVQTALAWGIVPESMRQRLVEAVRRFPRVGGHFTGSELLGMGTGDALQWLLAILVRDPRTQGAELDDTLDRVTAGPWQAVRALIARTERPEGATLRLLERIGAKSDLSSYRAWTGGNEYMALLQAILKREPLSSTPALEIGAWDALYALLPRIESANADETRRIQVNAWNLLVQSLPAEDASRAGRLMGYGVAEMPEQLAVALLQPGTRLLAAPPESLVEAHLSPCAELRHAALQAHGSHHTSKGPGRF